MVKENLIRIRKQKKFSQQDVAEHLNISQTSIRERKKARRVLPTGNGSVLPDFWMLR